MQNNKMNSIFEVAEPEMDTFDLEKEPIQKRKAVVLVKKKAKLCAGRIHKTNQRNTIPSISTYKENIEEESLVSQFQKLVQENAKIQNDINDLAMYQHQVLSPRSQQQLQKKPVFFQPKTTTFEQEWNKLEQTEGSCNKAYKSTTFQAKPHIREKLAVSSLNVVAAPVAVAITSPIIRIDKTATVVVAPQTLIRIRSKPKAVVQAAPVPVPAAPAELNNLEIAQGISQLRRKNSQQKLEKCNILQDILVKVDHFKQRKRDSSLMS